MKVGFVICPNCGNEVPVTSEGVCEICHEDLSAFAPPSETYEKLTPLETWIKALTAPSEKTFKQIVNQPGASAGTAVSWIYFADLISHIIRGVYRLITSTEPLASDDMFPLYAVLIFPISFSIFLLLINLIIVGMVYLFSRLFGGKGPLGKFIYGYAAYQAPLSVVITVPSILLGISGVSSYKYFYLITALIINLYEFVLFVSVNKVVNKFGWGKAILCTFTPLILYNILSFVIGYEASGIIEKILNFLRL